MPIMSGALIAGLISMYGSERANRQSRENAESANETSINLASTRYQRGVADLQAAGLNPMLAYGNAASPVPSMQVPNVNNSLGAGVNSAAHGFSVGKQASLIDEQIKTQQSTQELNKAMSIKAISDSELSTASAGEVQARTPTHAMNLAHTMAQIDKIAADNNLTFQQTMLAKQHISNAILTGRNIEADTGNKLADNQLKALSYTLQKTAVPAAFNQMNAADTFWGRNVSPFLPDLLKSSSIGKNVVPHSSGITINK